MSRRTTWYAPDISSAQSGSFIMALLRYRFNQDRWLADAHTANLISSRTEGGMHKPILDLDWQHRYVPSTTGGHAHLYLDIEISYARWLLLMIALRLAGVCEHGFVVWSIRRRGNFVRRSGSPKTAAEYSKVPEAPPNFTKRT